MKGLAAVFPLTLTTLALMTGCASSPDNSSQRGVPADTMACGQAEIGLDYGDSGGVLTIELDGREMKLKEEESASGARFVAVDDDDTTFWSKGESATLTVDGRELPRCLAPGAVELPFTASGNEPFWRVTVEPVQLVLERMGKNPVELRYETLETNASGQAFQAEGDGIRVSLAAAPQLCRDSMTGMPHPNQVRLTINGEAFRGCGGKPERLLRGTDWVVEDIGGTGVIDNSRVTLTFLAKDRVSGHASCNQFGGGWELTGEGIGFSQLVSTKKACAPALMDQETRFLSLLADVRRFDIGRHGELLLTTSGGQMVRAVQSTD